MNLLFTRHARFLSTLPMTSSYILYDESVQVASIHPGRQVTYK